MMSNEQTREAEQTLLDKVDALTDLVAALHRDPDAGAAADPLDTAHLLRTIAETATSGLRQAVPLAHDQGASWADVGRVLNISRQGAYDQFGKTYPPAPRRSR